MRRAGLELSIALLRGRHQQALMRVSSRVTMGFQRYGEWKPAGCNPPASLEGARFQMRIAYVFVLSIAPSAAFAADVASPVAPADSLQHFVLSPKLDLRIDLVAAEPDVIDPVAIAFDEHARMYVVEMRDYPNGPKDGEASASRIRLLEDADGDGLFETSHVFADGLLFATGVLPWDGGVIVTVAGEIRFLKDTNGDHAADVNEVWFNGFSEGNPQLRANHPTFGPDGWIYVANGLRGGKVTTVRTAWPSGNESPQTIELRDQDFRFNPRTGEAEAITGGGQFGMTFDAFGNRFICSNRNPCDHVVLETRAPGAQSVSDRRQAGAGRRRCGQRLEDLSADQRLDDFNPPRRPVHRRLRREDLHGRCSAR